MVQGWPSGHLAARMKPTGQARHKRKSRAVPGCSGKAKYIDEGTIARIAGELGERFGVTLRWYQCPACRFLHLTKSAQRARVSR